MGKCQPGTKRRRAEVPPPAVVEAEVPVAALHERPFGTFVTLTTVYLPWVSETARGCRWAQDLVVTDGLAFTQVVLRGDLAVQLVKRLKVRQLSRRKGRFLQD